MLYDISRIRFVERIDRSHFSYIYRMPYNIKATFGVFVPKWTNGKKKRGFQVLCRFFLNFCENFLFAYDTTVAWRFEIAIIIVFVKKQKFYWGFWARKWVKWEMGHKKCFHVLWGTKVCNNSDFFAWSYNNLHKDLKMMWMNFLFFW